MSEGPVTSDLIQGLIVDALMGATGAGSLVYAPRDWPTIVGEKPILMVQSPSEHKQGLGRSGAPQFTVLGTFRVVGRVRALSDAGDQGAMAALAAVGVLQRQIEVAVINDYALRKVIQEFSSVEVKTGVSRDGEADIAELVMDFTLEFYQGPEDFAPNVASPIDQMAVFADLVNVFSPSDSFTGTPFADQAYPAPRTAGPDGRAEGEVFVDFTQ